MMKSLPSWWKAALFLSYGLMVGVAILIDFSSLGDLDAPILLLSAALHLLARFSALYWARRSSVASALRGKGIDLVVRTWLRNGVRYAYWLLLEALLGSVLIISTDEFEQAGLQLLGAAMVFLAVLTAPFLMYMYVTYYYAVPRAFPFPLRWLNQRSWGVLGGGAMMFSIGASRLDGGWVISALGLMVAIATIWWARYLWPR